MSEITTLLIGMFILLLISFYLSHYDFYSPSLIICLVFTFGSMLALYSIAAWGIPESYFTYKATWIMLSGTAVFIFCEHIIKSLVVPKNHDYSIDYRETKPIHVSQMRMLVLICLCIFSTILYTYAMYNRIRANGYNSILSLSDLGRYNHALSFQDADNIEGEIGRGVRILRNAHQTSMYICMFVFLNNVICCKEKIRRNLIYLAPFIAWFPNVLITSSRGSLLQLAGACVLYFYIFICRKNMWRKRKRTFSKIVRYAVCAFVLTLLLFYMGVNSGFIGRTTNKTLVDYIAVYIGLPIVHFNQFLTNPPTDVMYHGQETFTKLFPVLKRFGLVDIAPTGQMEVRNVTGIYSGNVYTFFRRPLHDFGLLGMYLIVALTAIVFSYVYYKKIYGKYQSYKGDRTLILYSYFFYIIYIFSIDNAIYLYLYFGILYYLIETYLLYAFLLGKIRFGNKKVRFVFNKQRNNADAVNAVREKKRDFQ